VKELTIARMASAALLQREGAAIGGLEGLVGVMKLKGESQKTPAPRMSHR